MMVYTVAVCVVDAVHNQGVPRKWCEPGDTLPPNRAPATDRINLLRAEMKRAHSVQGQLLEAYIITYNDAHLNEFVADKDKRLEYISGFTGHGTAVVTMYKAALWTIDMYINQANEELSCEWMLMNNSVSIASWLSNEVQAGHRIGADPKLLSNSQWELLSKQLYQLSLYLLPIKNNLVDIIWHPKPNHTHHEAFVLPIEYAGASWYHKVTIVRSIMKTEGCDALIITALDEIAWLLNIRGRDIPFVPVLSSYLILAKDQIHLYAHQRKIGKEVKEHLKIEGCYAANCIRLHGYDLILDDIVTLSQKWKTVCLPTNHLLTPGVSRAIFFAVPVDKRKSLFSPVAQLKADKNEIEKKGMANAHLRDAAAFCYAMSYIQSKINNGEYMDEMEVAELLDSARREQAHNQGISFKTVVAFGKNGAFPHYEPRNETVLQVNKTNVLLIDSGGQYLDGTTDVSRTFHFGKPTSEQKEIYTRLLMGHINFASVNFPSSVTLSEVDILARAPLWAAGLDYNHGTSHGVGAFLSVHEGPILVSRTYNQEPFRVGYFLSDEPGYYKEGQYGMRLESVLEVVAFNKSNTRSSEKFLGFRPVTLVPFEPKLINVQMLSPQQVRWLNDYNSRIRNEVGAELKKQGLMGAFHWMMEKVIHIPERPYLYSSASKIKIYSPQDVRFWIALITPLLPAINLGVVFHY